MNVLWAIIFHLTLVTVKAEWVLNATGPQNSNDIKIVLTNNLTDGQNDYDQDLHSDIREKVRIVNGTFTFPGEFPFLVALVDITEPVVWISDLPIDQVKGEIYCSGTIIGSSHVLTACHCILNLKFEGRAQLPLRRPQSIMIIAGMHNVEPKLRKKLVYRRGTDVFPHPKCTVTFSQTIWDMGIILLEEPLNIIPRQIDILEVYSFVQANGQKFSIEEQGKRQVTCVVTGFGVNFEHKSPYLSRKADTTLLSSSLCAERLRNATKHLIDGPEVFDNSSQLCTVSTGTACDGDSGGPLLCFGPPPMKKIQFGVVSHAFRCGNESVPVIYARIDEAYKWILTVLHPDAPIPLNAGVILKGKMIFTAFFIVTLLNK